MDASRTADIGIQILGIAMQGDIAGAADLDLGLLGRRDIDIAMAAELHPGGAGRDLAEIGAARAADLDIEIVDDAIGDHGAGARDIQLGGARQLTDFGVARSGDRILRSSMRLRLSWCRAGDFHLAAVGRDLAQIHLAGAGDAELDAVFQLPLSTCRIRRSGWSCAVVKLGEGQMAAGQFELSNSRPGRVRLDLVRSRQPWQSRSILPLRMRRCASTWGSPLACSFVVGARRVAGVAEHHQARHGRCRPSPARGWWRWRRRSLATRPAIEQEPRNAVVQMPAADGGGGAHADRRGAQAQHGDGGEFVHHDALLLCGSAAGADIVDAARPGNMGFQLLGIGMQVDVARAGDVDIGFVGGRDVGIAAAGDMHFADMRRSPRPDRRRPIRRCEFRHAPPCRRP